MSSLLKTYSTSLNDESLCTLLTEAEAIANSCPSITDLLRDVNSMIPLSLINLLTLKSRVVMPPPGVFNAPDIYCCKHLGRVQHISNESWSRWRREILATLHCQQICNDIKRNYKVGDIVLLKQAVAELVAIVAMNTDENGFVRSVHKVIRGINPLSKTPPPLSCQAPP